MSAFCGDFFRKFFVIALLLLLIGPDVGNTLKCYACSSLNNPACSDPPDLTALEERECGSLVKNPVCSKRITKTPTLTFTGRQCLNEDICDFALNLSGQLSEECATCTTDLCNSSLQLSPNCAVIALGISCLLGLFLLLGAIEGS
ncbi:hypothetical protein DMENIID0001_113390 [Sergentomyia squamirostris]